MNIGTDLLTPHDEGLAGRASRFGANLLLDVMPNAVFVVDTTGSLEYVNDRLCAMVGRSRESLLGEHGSILIDPRDLDHSRQLVDVGQRLGNRVLGPVALRFLSADGGSRSSQFWAHPIIDDGTVTGFIVTFTEESVRDVLATAVNDFAHEVATDGILSTIAGSARARPLDGIGTILLVEPTAPTDRDRFRVIGDWPIDPEMVNGFGTPWRQCLVQGDAQDIVDVSIGILDARVGAAMAMAGLPSAWIRPIKDRRNETVAVLIVWRRAVSMSSPNHDLHLREAIRLARVALEQASEHNAIELATHRDPLTGVGSRAALNDRLALQSDSESVVFVDLDRFRAINDTFGHDVGDEVIAQVGARLKKSLRADDDVYRFGGDQFVVICKAHPDDAPGILHLGERLVERLAAPYDCARHRVRISASIGAASAQSDPDVARTLSQVIDAACGAMYVAKDRGRGCVSHADLPS